MRSTTEKQWRDPKWWNENAGSASYYCPVNAQFYDSKLHPCCIPRPTQWQGPQDGLPPVGTECEIDCDGDGFEKGTVVAYLEDMIWLNFYSRHPVRMTSKCEFRPIQSERDKAIEEAMSHVRQDWSAQQSVTIGEFVTNAVVQLYDAGYRKPMSRAEANNALIISTNLDGEDIRSVLDALGYKD